jgi:hypothetical protein
MSFLPGTCRCRSISISSSPSGEVRCIETIPAVRSSCLVSARCWIEEQRYHRQETREIDAMYLSSTVKRRSAGLVLLAICSRSLAEETSVARAVVLHIAPADRMPLSGVRWQAIAGSLLSTR